MKLKELTLTHFRCYKNPTTITFDDLTVFIGKNDAGKSSVLDALKLFFADDSPDGDDICVQNDDGQVRIACVFTDFPSSLVIDAAHPTTLAAEHMLNGNGDLEITKVYDCTLGSKKGKLRAVTAKAVHPTAASYNDLLTLTNTKLKARATTLGVDLANVNQTINTELRQAIWAHADDLGAKEVDIELKSEAAKEIWDQLKKALPVFALFKSDRPSTDQDAEAQDPMKMAIKEAIAAQQVALDRVAQMVEKQVQEIANRTVEKIKELDPELASQLNPRIVTKNWDSLFNVSLTGDDAIPINKRGSGTRRLILLSFFRAQAERDALANGTGIIYAVEEPETSQHPNNQKLLVAAFDELSQKPDCQVILTTHTPVLARRFSKSALRFVGKQNGHPLVCSGANEANLEQMVRSIGVLPDHSVKCFLGVEGRNDINFLTTISRILSGAGEDVPDLAKAEAEGKLVFVPLGGSSLDLWVSRLQNLGRPEFYLMDRDTIPPLAPHYQKEANQFQAQVNTTAWTTQKLELENYIHHSLLTADYPNYAGGGNHYEDVPNLFAQAVHETDPNAQPWANVLKDDRLLKSKESNAKRRLNTSYVGKMTPDLLTACDPANEVRGWLHSINAVLQAH